MLALLPPAALAAVAWMLVHDNASTVRGVASFLLAALAAPVLLVAGVPLSGGPGAHLWAIAASAALWLLVGMVASHRATRLPVATWRDFWRDYLWLAAGVWLGVVAALAAANLLLGRTLV